MLKIENTEVVGWKAAIRGMRNAKNSWDKSDSGYCHKDLVRDCVTCVHHNSGYAACAAGGFDIGPSDFDLMKRLRNAGTDHRKFMRMIIVYVDITAPLYWWKEFDTYKVGTVANSCSTMHKIADKEFTLEDLSCEHLLGSPIPNFTKPAHVTEHNKAGNSCYSFGLGTTPACFMEWTIDVLNTYRELFIKTKDKTYWWQMIQLLPSSYNQKRTVMLSYEVLANIYKSRKHHKLDEWHTFCNWIKTLPYSELITGGSDYLNKKLTILKSDEIISDALRKLRNPDAASPDESKAILLEFYEKMRKGDTSNAKPE